MSQLTVRAIDSNGFVVHEIQSDSWSEISAHHQMLQQLTDDEFENTAHIEVMQPKTSLIPVTENQDSELFEIPF